MASDAPIRVEPDHAARYPGADRLATECVLNVVRTSALLRQDLSPRLAAHGLTGPSFNLLLVLEHADEPLSPRQLAERLFVTPGTITGLLDTLERQGLVRRVRHPDDRRQLRIELADEALPVIAASTAEHFPRHRELLSTLSERDKQTLVRLLGKLQTALLDRQG